MELLEQLEFATEALLQKNRQLQSENAELRSGQAVWQEERAYLLAEIDRIIKRLDTVKLEEA